MASYALDANVVLRWLLQAGSVTVDRFWEDLLMDDELFAPPLLLPECTSIIRENVYLALIPPERGRQLVQELVFTPLTVVGDVAQFPRAFDLAERFQHVKAYDMQYLAVAEIAQAELVTADRGLAHAAREIGVPVRLLR